MSRRSSAGAVAALIAALILGAALLLSLTTGAGVYRQVQYRSDSSMDQRLGLSYITEKVHAHDAAGMVSAGEFGGCDAVFLLQELDGVVYETILYVHDGWLKELFCEQGWELEPGDGQQITEARGLSAALEGRLLRLVYTDAGGTAQQADIYVRSGM